MKTQTQQLPTGQDTEAPASTVAKKQALPELWEKSAIIARQDKIKTTLGGLDEDIHAVAVQCLLHCKKHRDTSLMRRFLVDIIDTSTGYRRAGLIGWMRTYSPMELQGDNINLSGKDPVTGKERPFRIAEAMANPFRSDNRYKEQLVPFFTDNLRSTVQATIKRGRAAIQNAKDGKPIEVDKPFFDGVQPEAVMKALDALEVALQMLPKDDTRARRKAEEEAKRLGMTVVDGGKQKAA